jgi:hypothetical protein
MLDAVGHFGDRGKYRPGFVGHSDAERRVIVRGVPSQDPDQARWRRYRLESAAVCTPPRYLAE